MKAHRAVLLSGMLGLLAVAALAQAGGCNGTGVTPMCDYPDGANDPEAGCGTLLEASTTVDAPVEDSAPPPPAGDAGDSGAGQGQDADATTPPPVDSGQDANKDAEKDAPEDVKDSSADHKG